MAQTICKVCLKQFAKYTCPRCNLQYCSLTCYRSHGVRCTEGFYSENVAEELRQTTFGDEGKRQMMEILQRFHDSSESLPGTASKGPAPPDVIDEGEESRAEDREEEGLSSETLANFMAQVGQGQDLDIQESDLSPADRAAFERALANGSLARLVSPWEPWWRGQEAAHMSLSAAGTRIIRDPNPQGDVGVMPPPPSMPLPVLASLSKAQPSPHLRWQLVDILYSYCLTLYIYNGEWTPDPQGAAATAMAASAALGSQRDLAAPAPSPTSAAEAILDCLSRACRPSLCGPAGRGFAVSVLDDAHHPPVHSFRERKRCHKGQFVAVRVAAQ
ncbi:hypothetical protein WJX75_008819 [Coccomyxa subellipsoidea]|uniref:HIT-type domain-containing protein n=1 Tax=Coccomyxa subellipsoidea TaxID=248742 RepID=A0ABR2YLW0_9CHLO